MKANHMSMQGGGYYNDNCTLQRKAIEAYLTTFQPAPFESVSHDTYLPTHFRVEMLMLNSHQKPLLSSQTMARPKARTRALPILHIAKVQDFQSFPTLTIQSFWLLERLLEQSPSVTSATLVFDDTPSNDFNSLASTIDAQCTELARSSKISINPLMAPKSHFQQVLPDGFVDAGYCFTALHWLQRPPPQGTEDSAALAKPASAHADLVAFLSARHHELRAGGTLMLCIPGQGPIGVEAVLSCVTATAREVSGTYSISPSVVARMPLYLRTMDEILAAVSASEGAWDVLQSAAVPTPHPACLDPTADRICSLTGVDRFEEYAGVVAGFAMAALSGFLAADARANMGGSFPGDGQFVADFTAAYKRVFLRSYGCDEVGFTYLYVNLRKM
jgi:hypothetical protein